jgi:hypothetical protein
VLRKEANFGCAKCGIPIVTIHHIEGYEEGVFRPEELVELCDAHHKMADKCALSKQELYALKSKPFNSDRVHHAFQIPATKVLIVHLGGNQFIQTPIPLQIHQEPVISLRIENGQLLLSVTFYDADDLLRLKMVDNVWDADIDVFDLRYSERAGAEVHLAVKMQESEPYLDLMIVNGEVFLKGKFYRKGMLFEIDDSGTFQAGKSLFMRGCTARGMSVGINIA